MLKVDLDAKKGRATIAAVGSGFGLYFQGCRNKKRTAYLWGQVHGRGYGQMKYSTV